MKVADNIKANVKTTIEIINTDTGEIIQNFVTDREFSAAELNSYVGSDLLAQMKPQDK
jgi:molybdopterin-binding protein